jgi:branched-chain amino acid transport system substrate-binding protein
MMFRTFIFEEVAMRQRAGSAGFAVLCVPVAVCMLCAAGLPGAQETKKEIVVGAHLPLTGALAMQSVEQRWAYEQAVKDVNKSGGIYVKQYGRKLPVRLIVIDDETDPVKASKAVKELVLQRKVDLLLSGCTAVYGVLPGLAAAERLQKYYHATTIWIPDFLKYDFKWGTMFFCDFSKDADIIYKVWDALPEDRCPKKIGVFCEATNDGEQTGALWKAFAEKHGYEIVLREAITPGDKDFAEQILKAKSAGVDAVLLMCNMEETVTFVRQMKKVDFSVKYLMTIKGGWSQEFSKSLGAEADYVLCDGFWSMDLPFNGAKALGEQHMKEFGKRSVGVGMYYALCQILWQGIEKAGTLNSSSVREAILDNTFETVMGRVDYDEKGVAVFPLTLQQWWKGKQYVIYPFEYSSSKLKTALPWAKR